MLNASSPNAAAMEGKGAYNRHAAHTAAAAALVAPLLEQAAWRIDLDDGVRPIVIADYGSSEGKNSLAPMRVAIAALRARVGRERAICVCHTDRPTNDFSSLFVTLANDPESYLRDDPHVHALAAGRSFYDRMLPGEYVDLGWSSYAAQWLSRIPQPIPGHIFPDCCTGAVRADFVRQSAEDWETFLAHRAGELRPGGRLVIAQPASRGEEGPSSAGISGIMDELNAVLADLVSAGVITAAEYAAMTIPVLPRGRGDLLAPFAAGAPFSGLVVEHCDIVPTADAAWNDYERNGDAGALARKRAKFVRAVFIPTLMQQLDPARSDGESLAFADRLEAGLADRLVVRPAPLKLPVGTIVVARQNGTGARH